MSDQKKPLWSMEKGVVPMLGSEERQPKDYEGLEQAGGMDTHKYDLPMAGSFSIVAMLEPDAEKLFKTSSGSIHRLHLDFETEEWNALFYGVLDCPEASDEPLSFNESEEEWEERFSQKFLQAIPEHPMLGRIWDMFIYVSYQPQEVGQLRIECQKLLDKTSDEKASKGLTKLIKACDSALSSGYGLLLIPD